MYAVASLLDDYHDHLVRDLWADLQNRFGVCSPFGTPLAHISYQVAEDYDIPRLRERLHRCAMREEPFKVYTGGLGLFPGPIPVIYIPVVRGPRLAQLHECVSEAIEGVGVNISPHYHRERWFPHITLVQADYRQANFSEMMKYLCDRQFYWEMTIENLTLISGTTSSHAFQFRLDFPGQHSR